MAWLFRLLHLHRRVRIEPLPPIPWSLRDQKVCIERQREWMS